ncbi:TlpA disulfide reductase family protein [Salinisphaera hydrothermalis]|uniref:Redoxin domain-containing protein n=1 Tax=Salinisphaera hydrothermalis (strain C41B8) TaxID=1304275 RepID=A0A084IP10_SALHC|nr:TlpA disulfide reductase family protein [Salinisphaera hydrothermalis]KEZ78444.1 redoxin domain-containing protein [Salinisphaera hydrothermalis C41B8]
MNTLSVGPFTLAVDHALMILSLIAAMIAGRLAARDRNVPIIDTLISLALAGILAARLIFVLRYWNPYSLSPVSIIDIRDGGFDAVGGLVGMAAYASFAVWRRPRLRRPLGLAILAGSLVWGATGGALQLIGSSRMMRPDVPLQTLTGRTTTLDALARAHPGAPMVVNLWASWCPPCRAEMPMLAAAQRAHPGVLFIFANQGESPAKIEAFLRRESLSPNHVLVDAGQRLARAADARAFPTTLFFDGTGHLVERHLGLLSRATLARGLDRLSVHAPTKDSGS